MKNKYILGAGPAGLIAAFYNKDYKIVDEKPLGQLNLPFIPGPRLLQATENMENFIKEVLPDSNITSEVAVIGFNKDGDISDKPSSKFKKAYAKKTRDRDTSESSFLSEGMTEIQHIEINGLGEDSYKFLFTELLKIIVDRKQLVKTSIKKLCVLSNKIEFTDGTESDYHDIISTLNLNILKKITPHWDENMHYNLDTTNKCFYKADYCDSIEDMMDSKKHPSLWYDYIYSADTNWTRQTFFRDYIVYESVNPIEGTHIQGNEIQMKFENLPIQIKESHNIERMDGLTLLGRFAQWSHKIKANEVLDRVLELKNG
tara:strand:+ start:99 stop:1043 length:945 start_codon:yes stop_codon:yes gene_type:complete